MGKAGSSAVPALVAKVSALVPGFVRTVLFVPLPSLELLNRVVELVVSMLVPMAVTEVSVVIPGSLHWFADLKALVHLESHQKKKQQKKKTPKYSDKCVQHPFHGGHLPLISLLTPKT